MTTSSEGAGSAFKRRPPKDTPPKEFRATVRRGQLPVGSSVSLAPAPVVFYTHGLAATHRTAASASGGKTENGVSHAPQLQRSGTNATGAGFGASQADRQLRVQSKAVPATLISLPENPLLGGVSQQPRPTYQRDNSWQSYTEGSFADTKLRYDAKSRYLVTNPTSRTWATFQK